MEYKNDLYLLRPATLEHVKAGGKICWWNCVEELEYFVTKDDMFLVTWNGDSSAHWFVDEIPLIFRQLPLCWIKNRPVYKGDILYGKYSGQKYEADGTEDDEDFTWTKPVTKKKYWVNLYEDQKYGKYWQPHDDRERADNAATYSNGKVDINRIACVEIELPVKE